MLNKLLCSLLLLSFFTEISAEDQEPEERLLLIVGCGRSGTKYIQKVLEHSGIHLGHEHVVEKDGMVSWLWSVDADNEYPWGYPRKSDYHFAHVFHQVRHPLKVISSRYYNYFFRRHKRALFFVVKKTRAISPRESLLVICAKYWYYWNLLAGEKAEWRYRIEDLEEVWDEYQQRLGVVLNREGLEKITKDTNHKKDYERTLTWEDLRIALNPVDFKNIQDLAAEYGYSIEDE